MAKGHSLITTGKLGHRHQHLEFTTSRNPALPELRVQGNTGESQHEEALQEKPLLDTTFCLEGRKHWLTAG